MKPEYLQIPSWSKRKEDIWTETFAGLDGKPKRIFLRKYAAIAAVAVVLTAGITAGQYTVTQIAERGKHLRVLLPDQSLIYLNAESKISYKPYGWFFSRNVELQGEAYFRVKPGNRFCVTSGKNRVNVLGTTFIVFSRPEMYRVTCLTGKVEALACNERRLLEPNKQITYRENGKISNENVNSEQSTAWMQNKFAFAGSPLVEVIAEIERQYDIRISTDENLDFTYTGNFPKMENPEEILEIIGKPFGIEFKIEK
jgi:ferric-dicitrate binding protein FerR (iron transport regulator)